MVEAGSKQHYEDLREFLSREYSYAVVGASRDRNKYGNIVFRDLRDAGFRVVPVNPNTPSVEGVLAVQRLQDVQPTPDVAVVVVPPDVGITILDDAKKAGVKRLWFQPGAESPAIIVHARQLGLSITAIGACIMVIRRQFRI